MSFFFGCGGADTSALENITKSMKLRSYRGGGTEGGYGSTIAFWVCVGGCGAGG